MRPVYQALNQRSATEGELKGEIRMFDLIPPLQGWLLRGAYPHRVLPCAIDAGLSALQNPAGQPQIIMRILKSYESRFRQ
jgi:hypothetical protein